jgi:hypothetical protein
VFKYCHNVQRKYPGALFPSLMWLVQRFCLAGKTRDRNFGSRRPLWINPAAACEFLPTRAVVRHGYKGLSSFETLPCLQSIESTIRRKADGYRTELNDAMAAFVKAKFTDCSCSFIECVQELIIRRQRCVQWGHARAR